MAQKRAAKIMKSPNPNSYDEDIKFPEHREYYNMTTAQFIAMVKLCYQDDKLVLQELLAPDGKFMRNISRYEWFRHFWMNANGDKQVAVMYLAPTLYQYIYDNASWGYGNTPMVHIMSISSTTLINHMIQRITSCPIKG